MTLINLTPHAISIFKEDDTIMTIKPSGEVARVGVMKEVVGSLDGIPIKTSVFGEVEGLPSPEEGKVYLVSSLVAQRVTGRDDVFIPDDPVRDESGRIVGCRSLGRI